MMWFCLRKRSIHSSFLTGKAGALLLAGLLLAATSGGAETQHRSSKGKSATTHTPAKGAASTKKTKSTAGAARTGKRTAVHHGAGGARAVGNKKKAGRGRTAGKPSARAVKLATVFRETTELRPMAQQLASQRSAAAFAGVQGYARTHSGEPAAAAQLALGHAYMLDRRYAEAAGAFSTAANSETLGDYAEFLGAQAAMQGNQPQVAIGLLTNFNAKHPESIFASSAPVALAGIYEQQGNGTAALAALQPVLGTEAARAADVRFALARAYQVGGQTGQAAAIYREIYVKFPLSNEAKQSRAQLEAMGQPLTAAEQKMHADQLFNAKHYAEAAEEYHALQRNDSSLSAADKDALTIYGTVCDLKLKRAGRREIENLPVTNDDSAALKQYMLAEVSRTEGDRGAHDAIIQQMVQQYPASRWTEEALYSGGNMYLLLHDANQAILHYGLLVKLFPDSTYAPSAHWRMAWMNYRIRNYSEAARLMEEQLVRYRGGLEIPTALYWRARMLEDEEHRLPEAAAYYRVLAENYANYYYAMLARQRLAVLGAQPALSAVPATLNGLRRPEVPDLDPELPEDDEHLIKARLLANAALNDYIGPEIQASPSSSEWGALAQAEIYASFGETTRSLQSMKHNGLPFFVLPIDQVPEVYWRLLFPRPYWNDIVTDSQANGLDPFLVASLIRQETEFNAGAVSRANAYGLMQLLPSTGKGISKHLKQKGFTTAQLLVPAINLQLGTANLREVLNRYDGQVEYALAAYNAGDGPVRQWMSAGEYKDTPEFVESIPYTETREYVQAILRNREMYRALYGSSRLGVGGGAAVSR